MLALGDLIGMPPRVWRRLIESFRLEIESLSEHRGPSCVLPISVFPLLGVVKVRNQVAYKVPEWAGECSPQSHGAASGDLKGGNSEEQGVRGIAPCGIS